MAQDTSDEIKIEGTPLQEFEKKTSCLRRSCLVALLILVVGLTTLGIFAHYISTPNIASARELPNNFPASIPIYDAKSIDTITIVTGRRLPDFLKPVTSWFVKNINAYIPKNFMAVPHDAITITWVELPASANFIKEYYTAGFKKQSYYSITVIDAVDLKQLDFSTTSLQSSLTIRDDPDSPGTDLTTLTVEIQP